MTVQPKNFLWLVTRRFWVSHEEPEFLTDFRDFEL